MNRIRELRKAKGISQTKLAKKLGFTQGNLSGWENGKWQPDQESIIKMCDIFEVSADYLLGRTNTPGFSPADNAAGYTNTIKEEITPLEDDLLFAFRKLGDKKGNEMQKVAIHYIETLIDL